MTLRSGSRLGPSAPTQDGIPGVLHLNVSGTVTVEASAVIDLHGSGYKGGDNLQADGEAPEGLTPSGQFTGGSHGGQGSYGFSTARTLGDVYDSPYQPYLPGGGGGHRTSTFREWGGSGGGAFILVAQTLDLWGEVLATGVDRDGRAPTSNTYPGAGAGGTVSIEVTTLTGGGTIDASGGDYQRGGGDFGGLGGGGRVVLLAQTLNGFDPALQVTARGGRLIATDEVTVESEAAPGTLYIFTSGAIYGDLFVDQGPASGGAVPPTVLPSPGTGIVGTVTADAGDPNDLWIEPSDPAVLFDLGVVGLWLRVGGTDYRILAQTGDRRQLLLEGAAATVAGTEGYSGVYKLDTVTVRGGANLEFRDTAEITTIDVDVDSTLTIPKI